MIDIITWLANNEKRIGMLYHKASDFFREDTHLSSFLKNLALDEELHYRIMERAAEFYDSNPGYEAAVIIDTEIDERITGILDNLSCHLESGTLTKPILCKSIINAEFSEWNSVFLYVVESLKNDIDEFNEIGKLIQGHKHKVEEYYENLSEYHDIINSYKQLEPVWKDKILLVDDNVLLVELLSNILSRVGHIDKAYDGIEAFTKLEENQYKLIISDIDMPKMDGISFFEKSSSVYPDLNERFIFFSGDISPDRISYFEQKNVGYIEKPERMDMIRTKALQILMKDNHNHYSTNTDI